MNIKYMIILASFCFYACLAAKDPDYEDIASSLRSEIIKSLAKKYNMPPCNTYGELFECVNAHGAGFDIYGLLTKDEARKILVDCTETFLERINKDKKIRPFLKEFPFTNKKIHIVIYINDKKSNSLYHPELSVVT